MLGYRGIEIGASARSRTEMFGVKARPLAIDLRMQNGVPMENRTPFFCVKDRRTTNVL